MPRHTLLSMERSLTGLVPPGTRVAVMAISCIFESKKTRSLGKGAPIRTPYVTFAIDRRCVFSEAGTDRGVCRQPQRCLP